MLPPKAGQTHYINLPMDKQLHRRLKVVAEQEGLHVAQLLRKIILEYVEYREAETRQHPTTTALP